MKLSPWYLALLTPFAVAGSGAMLGHLLVLSITLGIFFGTLSLGRTPVGRATATPLPVDRADAAA